MSRQGDGDRADPRAAARGRELDGAWSRVGALAAMAWCLALTMIACGGLLGIEQRALDDDEYPADGYEGCRSGSCGGCILPAHRSACEAGGSGGGSGGGAGSGGGSGGSGGGTASACQSPNLDSCERCACEGGCRPAVDECQGTPGCLAIWTCINAHKCELLESSPESCHRPATCQVPISENGGATGEAFLKAAQIRACAAGAACFTCLPPEPEPPPECTPAAGCQGCDDCQQTCLCSGDTYATCLDACGEPPSDCTPETNCENCPTCFDLCSCGGGGFDECNDSCRPICDPAAGCVDCSDCISQCLCDGGDDASCQAECAPPPGSSCRKADPNGSGGDCSGCQGCLAQCTCTGASVSDCMAQCGYSSCSDGDCGCGGDYDACTCQRQGDPSGCAYDLFDCEMMQCSPCACDKCPDEYALCLESDECNTLLQCMRDTDCQGVQQCMEQCSTGSGGGVIILPPLLGSDPSGPEILEALNACLGASECAPCGG